MATKADTEHRCKGSVSRCWCQLAGLKPLTN